MRSRLFLTCALLLLPAAAAAQDITTLAMTPADAVTWSPLDPAAPDGIQIHVISGDPTAGPFRALLRFPAGFNSGLHSHTADYGSVGISGTRQHGATAETLVDLAPGSYTLQPGGEPHVDVCIGPDFCFLYVDMAGALDFLPADAPPSAPAQVTVPIETVTWAPLIPDMPAGPQMHLIAGDPATGPVTVLLQVPASGDSGVHSHTSPYTAVVVSGPSSHGLNADSMAAMSSGSYWIQPGGENHLDRCGAEGPCMLFIQMDGPWDSIPAAQ